MVDFGVLWNLFSVLASILFVLPFGAAVSFPTIPVWNVFVYKV